jgi:hypothetical protein
MKKKKVSSENVQMTKKEREAMQVQLEKESEIRRTLEQVMVVLAFHSCSWMPGNKVSVLIVPAELSLLLCGEGRILNKIDNLHGNFCLGKKSKFP